MSFSSEALAALARHAWPGNVRELRNVVERLALLRINHLQLYTEHTFAYADHEVVWRHASPLTHDDMAWIARRGAERGIDLVANMNGFGHMERMCRFDGADRHLD